MCGLLVDEMVPIHLLVIITELKPRATFHCRPRSIFENFSLQRRHQKATTEDLACVVDREMDMLSSLALTMKLDEAFSAEKVYTIFTKNGCIEVFTLQADKSVDHAFHMLSKLPSVRMDLVKSLV